MKNLSKRNKILLGVLSALVIIVVVGVALGLTGNLPLQGGPLTAYLSPKHGCFNVGETKTYTLYKYGMNTSWKFTGIGFTEVSHDRTHFTIKATAASVGGTESSGLLHVHGVSGYDLDTATANINGTDANCP